MANFFQVALQDSAGEPSSKRVLAAVFACAVLISWALNYFGLRVDEYVMDALVAGLGICVAGASSEWFSSGYRAVNKFGEIP